MPPSVGPNGALAVRPDALGSADFRRDHGVRYAYVAGSMYRAVASEDLVIRMSRAGLLGYFGSGGLRLERVEAALERFRRSLGPDHPYGLNLLPASDRGSSERHLVDLLLRHDVRWIEVGSYPQLTPGLVRYRVSGLRRAPDGSVVASHKVLAKVSQPETAAAFLEPPPEHLVRHLVAAGDVSAAEAELARRMPMADDICAEVDPAGHPGERPFVVLLPELVRLRDRIGRDNGFGNAVRVGVAGGIGTPESVAAAFVVGADFVLTGSINQCTVEAGTTDAGKDLLQQAPASQPSTVSEAALAARSPKYLRRAFGKVWEEARESYQQIDPYAVERAEHDPRYRMALVFKWYLLHTARPSRTAPIGRWADHQIASGPAIGSLNSYLRGTPLENWRSRHVDEIAELLMTGAAELLSQRLAEFAEHTPQAR